MKKELDYIQIDHALGGSQSWFRDWKMYFGGCAAVTACDLCLYLAVRQGKTSLYPYDKNNLTRQDYIQFAKVMQPYLRPRLKGIDTLEVYVSGISTYWRDTGNHRLQVAGLSGAAPLEDAKSHIRAQIDQGMPIPYLLLLHKSPSMRGLQWHWFNLAGYKESGEAFSVKVVTYGVARWLDLQELWNTGHRRKGGIIRVWEQD